MNSTHFPIYQNVTIWRSHWIMLAVLSFCWKMLLCLFQPLLVSEICDYWNHFGAPLNFFKCIFGNFRSLIMMFLGIEFFYPIQDSINSLNMYIYVFHHIWGFSSVSSSDTFFFPSTSNTCSLAFDILQILLVFIFQSFSPFCHNG